MVFVDEIGANLENHPLNNNNNPSNLKSIYTFVHLTKFGIGICYFQYSSISSSRLNFGWSKPRHSELTEVKQSKLQWFSLESMSQQDAMYLSIAWNYQEDYGPHWFLKSITYFAGIALQSWQRHIWAELWALFGLKPKQYCILLLTDYTYMDATLIWLKLEPYWSVISTLLDSNEKACWFALTQMSWNKVPNKFML